MQLFKILEQTLSMGENSITFIDNSINDDCIIEIYTDNTNVVPLSATQDGHTVTIIFEIQPVDVNVKLCINNIVDDFGNYDGLDSYSTTSSLSANQGRILKELIDESGESAKIDYGTTEEFDEVKDILDVGTSYYITDDYDEMQNIYSTDEVRIGTFLGKPLYRKGFLYNKDLTSTSDITSYIQSYMNIIVNGLILRYKSDDVTRNCCDPVTIWYNKGWKMQGVDTCAYVSGDTIYLFLDYTKVGE